MFCRKYKETGGQNVPLTVFGKGEAQPNTQYLTARLHGVTT